jgi:hypothetical protein
MVDGLPVDIIPSGVLRMVLVTAQERDASLGVLNGEDVAKRLRFEETETEREVQECTRERVEEGAECRTSVEREQSAFDLERLKRTHRERAQEMQSDRASTNALKGHIYLQRLDEAQKTRRRKNQITCPFRSADSEHDILEKSLARTASPRPCYQSAVFKGLIRGGGRSASEIFLERWPTDPFVTSPNVINDHVDQFLGYRFTHRGKEPLEVSDVG